MYAPPFTASDGWQNRLLFPLNSFLLQKSLRSGRFQLPSPPLGLKRYFAPRGEEVFDWVISSDSFPSMTLTHPPFSIALLAVTPLLTSPLLPPLLPFLASGRCFRSWVLTTYQFFYPFSLSGLSPTYCLPTSVPFLQLSESSLG